MAKEFKNYIDGKWQRSSSGKTFENINPANCNEADTADQDEFDLIIMRFFVEVHGLDIVLWRELGQTVGQTEPVDQRADSLDDLFGTFSHLPGEFRGIHHADSDGFAVFVL